MALIHALEILGNGKIRIAIHASTPPGNNPSGFPWSGCFVSDGRNTTALTVGDPATDPGNISAAEAASIAAGTVYEIINTDMRADDLIALGGAGRTSWANARITEAQDLLEERYDHYGFTQDT